jgi:hypothetical protein
LHVHKCRPKYNGHGPDFTADEGFDLVVGVAAGSIELQKCATLNSKQMIPCWEFGLVPAPSPGCARCAHPGLRFLAPTDDFRFDSVSESVDFENDRPIAPPT